MKNLFRISAALSFCAFVALCPAPPDQDKVIPPETFLQKVEAAHGAEAFRSHTLVKADIRVKFGGDEKLHGTMTFDTMLSRSRIDLADGTKLVFDGEDAWVSPAKSERTNARFDLMTFPYFMIVAMKLGDPGVRLKPVGEMPLFEPGRSAMKMTFESGTGDSPDDWYLLFLEPESNQLKAMCYIVTYWSGPKTEGKQVSAIVYDDYTEIEGAKFSRMWRFYKYDMGKGIEGEPIGQAEVSNIKFLPDDPALFVKPEDSRMDRHPREAEMKGTK